MQWFQQNSPNLFRPLHNIRAQDLTDNLKTFHDLKIVDVSFKLFVFSLIHTSFLLAARDQGEGANEIAVLSTVAAKATNRTASEFSRVYKLGMRRVEIQRL